MAIEQSETLKIDVVFHGILTDWLGTEAASFELPQGSVLADLLAQIGDRYSQNMPEQLWDKKQDIFNGPVLAVGEGRNLEANDAPLIDGEEIKFFLMLAGG